jgi:Matrixin
LQKGGLVAAVLMACLCVPNASGANESEFRLLQLDGSHVRWAGAVNGGTVVSYALLDRERDYAGTRNCGSMDPVGGLAMRSGIGIDTFRRELRAAFDLWEKAANLRFVEIADADTAGIVVGAQRAPVGRAFTEVGYKAGRNTAYADITRSLVCLNPRQPWKVGFDGNLGVYDLRHTLAHEIGHAIGLDHPATSQGQVMSFRYQEGLAALQAGDVSGARHLYGDAATWNGNLKSAAR